MTFVVCDSCGHRLLKRDAVVSKQSGRAWCVDQEACDHRAERNEMDARADARAEIEAVA